MINRLRINHRLVGRVVEEGGVVGGVCGFDLVEPAERFGGCVDEVRIGSELFVDGGDAARDRRVDIGGRFCRLDNRNLFSCF